MQPLSHQSRRTLLIALCTVFIVGVPILIAYSTGYRFDGTLTLVKTGGIYIHSDLPSTSVFIDNEFVEENGLLLRNTLIQNLTPNVRYSVRVQRDGYYTWFKDLTVYPNLVTEGRVLMLPTQLEWQEVAATTTLRQTNTQRSATTTIANPEYLALEEMFVDERDQFEVDVATTTQVVRGGVLVASTTIVREIELPEFLEEVPIINFAEKDMLRERQRLVTWLEDANVFAMWVGDEDATPYFFCSDTCNDTIEIDWQDDIFRYNFYPGRDDVLLVQNWRGVYAIELDNRSRPNIQPVYEAETPGEKFQFRVLDGSDIVIWEEERNRFLELVE